MLEPVPSCTENKFHQPGCVVIKESINQSMKYGHTSQDASYHNISWSSRTVTPSPSCLWLLHWSVFSAFTSARTLNLHPHVKWQHRLLAAGVAAALVSFFHHYQRCAFVCDEAQHNEATVESNKSVNTIYFPFPPRSPPFPLSLTSSHSLSASITPSFAFFCTSLSVTLFFLCSKIQPHPHLFSFCVALPPLSLSAGRPPDVV